MSTKDVLNDYIGVPIPWYIDWPISKCEKKKRKKRKCT